jgi:hypothetical protein
MVWFVIAFVFSALLDLFDLGRQSDREKDLEILILRHQLDILERKRTQPIKISKAEKLTLAVLTNKLKTISNVLPANFEMSFVSFNQKPF